MENKLESRCVAFKHRHPRNLQELLKITRDFIGNHAEFQAILLAIFVGLPPTAPNTWPSHIYAPNKCSWTATRAKTIRFKFHGFIAMMVSKLRTLNAKPKILNPFEMFKIAVRQSLTSKPTLLTLLRWNPGPAIVV